MDKDSLKRRLNEIVAEMGCIPKRSQFIARVGNGQRLLDDMFDGSYVKLKQECGLEPQETFQNTSEKQTVIKPPDLPDDDIPVDQIVDSMCKRYTKRFAAHNSKKWMEFRVDSDSPIGICWFGDPHIDDDGCNWPLLKEHIDLCKKTPGMFGANIGDTNNNWVGRLMKEYANQNTSRGTAWKLTEWFFRESGVNWLLMLLGNHDEWNFGSESLALMARHVCTMVDWRAQFKLVFPSGRECMIDAAHDHSGHSQWNPLHGQQKASTMAGIAHLYIAGHRHNWALAQHEEPNTNRIYSLARARGYKFIDSYAEKLGYSSQKYGASIVSVIDPAANDVNFVRCFADVKEGADYLTFLRNRK